MSLNTSDNTYSHINIRLKQPTQSKKDHVPPQSATRVQDRLEQYEIERQQKLKKLRDEFEQKERESMTPCTKPFHRKQDSSNSTPTSSKTIENSSIRSEVTYNESIPEFEYDINNISSPSINQTKKKTYAIDDSDLLKNIKCQERRKQKKEEIWDEDGNLINASRSSISQIDDINDDDYYIDQSPSPKRIEPKGKYPSLIERSLNAEKNRTPESSFTNSPKSSSPASIRSSSSLSSKSNSTFSPKSSSPKSTAASFKEFEERQQKLLDQRANQRKEAEKKIVDDANRSYTLPKSQRLYKSMIQRNGDPIRQRKKDDEINYKHIPDTTISRKRPKDQPYASVAKPWEMDSANTENKDDESTNPKNQKADTDKTFHIKDVEAQYIAREVQLRSREIEEESKKMADYTFTPQKFSKYKLSPKSSSPDNKYVANADKQMSRARNNGQKIRDEEETKTKINEKTENRQIGHKKAKPPSSTKKLMNIVGELKKEADDERYNEKKTSLFERSVGTMRRRSGKHHFSSLNSPKKNENEYEYYDDEEENANEK